MVIELRGTTYWKCYAKRAVLDKKKNLVFICSDQQRTDTMQCYGNDWVKAPNLNLLATQSYVFENSYVTQAVCTPARATMMTGLYPHSAGVIRNNTPGRSGSTLSPHTKCLPEMVPDDYVTAYFGKWHLGDDLNRQHGFDHWVSVEDARDELDKPISYKREDRSLKSDYFQYLENLGYEPEGFYEGHTSFTPKQRSQLPAQHSMSNFLGDEAYAFLQNHSGSDRPFILYVMMFEPHPPYNGPYNDMYDPSLIPDGEVFLEKPDHKSALFNRARSDYYLSGSEHDLNTADDWRRLRARYYGNVTLLDEGVGKVLQGLTDFGFEDDTAVIFTSDHGDSLGDRGMLNKRSFYEEVSRVPMIMKVPWLNIDQVKVSGNFGHVDIVPTLLDILGIEIPDHLQGSTVLGDILKGSDLHAKDVFMQWHGGLPTVNLGDDTVNSMSQIEWRSVVSGDRWKLNLSRGDQCELFDLNSDPFEKVNLFDSDDQKDRIREMTARIRGWQIATGDNLVLPAV